MDERILMGIQVVALIVVIICALKGYKKRNPPVCDSCVRLKNKYKPSMNSYRYICSINGGFDRAPEICCDYEYRKETEMAIRLYPDIIVAAEVNNMRRFEMFYEKRQDISEVDITIDDCLKHQQVYKHIGIRNVFLGFEGKEWGRWDYEVYLSRFPEYFKPVGGGKYHVDLAALAGDAEEEDIPLEICDKLFVLGTYPRRVMKTLGLYPCEEEGP